MILPFVRVVPHVALLLVVLDISQAGGQTETPGVEYGLGFSNVEHLKDTTWRWMDEEGVVKLKNARTDMILKFNGRPPTEAMVPEPPTMKVFLNGDLLEEFKPSAKSFDKEYKVSAAKLGDGLWCELKITTTKVVVPSDFNKKSKDDRRLGFRLNALSWLTAAGAPVEVPVPNRGAAVQEEVPAAPKGWLAAVLLIGLAITLLFAIGMGAWLFLRGRSDSA